MGGTLVIVTAFMYADDVALIADDADHLAAMLRVRDSVAVDLGFRFAPSKCEIVTAPQVNLLECKLHGEALTQSVSFKYLGVQMTTCGIDKKAHVLYG